MSVRSGAASIALVAAGIFASHAAYCQAIGAVRYDLPSQDLETSLRAVARLSGRDVMIASNAVAGKVAPPLHGEFLPDEAVRRLLRGSGVSVRFTRDAVLIGANTEADAGQQAEQPRPADIVVTGSRIRGGVVFAPVTTVQVEQAMREGRNSVAEMMTRIPQNFGGGQNPGVGPGVPGGANETGASSFNLRGLGSDATLTLIDGHRVAYGSTAQAIDISSIPFLAVDRIEVVADGGSALYGSDAVAGVANVILRDRFKGLEVAAGVGIPTEGGGLSQQYGAIAGTAWSTGSIYGAYEFARSNEVNANDRAFARPYAPGFTLYPSLRHSNVMAKFQQELSPAITVSLEGFYNDRKSVQVAPYDRTGDYLSNGQRVTSFDKSFAIMPSLRLALGQSWNVTASGTVAQDHARYINAQWFPGLSTLFTTCLCNGSTSADLNAEGALFHLPAGDVRLATGIGYRTSRFNKTDQRVKASQEDYFAYGELAIPLVSPGQGISGINRLSASVAGRLEKYRSIATVFTPKIGLDYSPTPGLEIKASWGESFRAPTLFQQYNTQQLALYPVTSLGGTRSAPSTAALLYLGGNQNLKPERAKTFVATVDMQPHFLPGARLELSYFDIRYRDRIVSPITYLTQALKDPSYAAYVDTTPTEAAKAALVDAMPLVNVTGFPYDPADVVAIVSNINVNAETQNVRGVDLSAGYDFDLAPGKLTLVVDGTYIDSEQQISGDQPVMRMAGTLYRPAHLRGRLGARYASDHLSISAFFNHVDGVKDVRTAVVTDISGQNTVDLALTVRPQWPGLLHNLQVTLSIENLNNDLPAYVAQTLVGYTPYDPTNFSALGRKIGLTLSNRW